MWQVARCKPARSEYVRTHPAAASIAVAIVPLFMAGCSQGAGSTTPKTGVEDASLDAGGASDGPAADSGKDVAITDDAPETDGPTNDGAGDSGPPGLEYGANIHPYADYGGGALAAIEAQFQQMHARHLTTARMNGVPGSSEPMMGNLVTAGKMYGITPSFMLEIAGIVCPTDEETFASNDATTIHDAVYQATLPVVTQYRNDIVYWELGNEIDLKAGQSAPPGLWNHGWTAADWESISYNGSPDYFANWAAAIRGAADAVEAVNTQYNLHLVRILNTTSTHVGFLDFMSQNGVNFDMISYHYYYGEGTSPYALAASAPGSNSNRWDLFAGLGAYHLPVTINEMNCAEIYDASYQNTTSDPLYATCLTNLRAQLGAIRDQTEMDLRSVYVYELLDEPSQAAPENHFGLFWNDGKGNITPKANLYLWSAFSGGALSTSEQTVLTSYGLLPLP